MDIGLFIVIMIVMYVVPEILKRLKPKRPHQYPDFPPALPQGGQGQTGIPGELSRGMKPPILPVTPTGEGLPGDEGDPAWELRPEFAYSEMVEYSRPDLGDRMRISSQEVAQGIIWAEIIAPPVAMRHMRHGIRRI